MPAIKFALLIDASNDAILLTANRLRHYSGEMISDFDTLSEKIGQLAELTQSLRSENAELRIKSAALAADNADLARRMQEAHERVSLLLEKIPAPEQNEKNEAAA